MVCLQGVDSFMPLNGTEFTDNPFDTVMSPFTELFGSSFFIIPIGFIALALYMKTRSTLLASLFVMTSSILMASGSLFTSHPDMAIVYGIFIVIGIVGTIGSVYFTSKS